jgi:hypothetical protein
LEGRGAVRGLISHRQVILYGKQSETLKSLQFCGDDEVTFGHYTVNEIEELTFVGSSDG